MTNILTAQQAANALRCDPTDVELLDLLPQVDSYLRNATGRDWTRQPDKPGGDCGGPHPGGDVAR